MCGGVSDHWIVGIKWWVAHQAFVHDDTQGPPVALLAVTVRTTPRHVGITPRQESQKMEHSLAHAKTVPGLSEDFGCDVVGRADGGKNHVSAAVLPAWEHSYA